MTLVNIISFYACLIMCKTFDLVNSVFLSETPQLAVPSTTTKKSPDFSTAIASPVLMLDHVRKLAPKR